MVYIDNKIAEGIDDREDGIEVPLDVYDQICDWATELEFDENDLFDTSRTKSFNEYDVCVEHFAGHPNDISVRNETNIAILLVEDFVEIEA